MHDLSYYSTASDYMLISLLHLEILYLCTHLLCIASVDVDRIAKEVDFQALQQNIMNITFCNIETEVNTGPS